MAYSRLGLGLGFMTIVLLFGCEKTSGTGPIASAPSTASAEKRARLNCSEKSIDELIREGNALSRGPVDDRNEEQAILSYSCACEGDNFEACYRAGSLHREARGLVPVLEEAERLLRKSCQGGEGNGCGELGLLLARIEKITPKQAFRLFEQGCEMGGQLSCALTGGELVWGRYLEVDLERARKLAATSCRAGVARGCAIMARVAEEELEKSNIIRMWFEKGCALNDGYNCAHLGGFILWRSDNKPNKADRKIAIKAFEHGCSFGSGYACKALGDARHNGEGVEKNIEEGTRLYKRACEFHFGEGCFYWGLALAEGNGVEQQIDGAFAPITEACEVNYGDACAWLGIRQTEGRVVPVNKTLAFSLFEKGCNNESTKACRKLLEMVARGAKYDGDTKKIVVQIEYACEMFGGDACLDAASIYGNGLTVKKSRRNAVSFLRGECDDDSLPACTYALYLLRSIGDPADSEEIADYYRTACSLGDPASCNELGHIMVRDDTDEGSENLAMLLFADACKADYKLACNSLAEGFEKGWGTPVDLRLAQEIYQKACNMGLDSSCERAKRLSQ